MGIVVLPQEFGTRWYITCHLTQVQRARRVRIGVTVRFQCYQSHVDHPRVGGGVASPCQSILTNFCFILVTYIDISTHIREREREGMGGEGGRDGERGCEGRWPGGRTFDRLIWCPMHRWFAEFLSSNLRTAFGKRISVGLRIQHIHATGHQCCM